MSNASEQNIHERIQREHDALRELLGKVHRTLTKRRESVANVSEMLQSLHRHVRTHFDEEEQGGFFEEIVSQAPRLSTRAETIQGEHARLNNDLLELIVCADDAKSEDWWQNLEAKFHEFSKELMRHESKENELLLEAYSDDIGAAD